MANIKISDLRPTGADLLLDSESYLNELTEQESVQVFGGRLIIRTVVVIDWSWNRKIDFVFN